MRRIANRQDAIEASLGSVLADLLEWAQGRLPGAQVRLEIADSYRELVGTYPPNPWVTVFGITEPAALLGGGYHLIVIEVTDQVARWEVVPGRSNDIIFGVANPIRATQTVSRRKPDTLDNTSLIMILRSMLDTDPITRENKLPPHEAHEDRTLPTLSVCISGGNPRHVHVYRTDGITQWVITQGKKDPLTRETVSHLFPLSSIKAELVNMFNERQASDRQGMALPEGMTMEEVSRLLNYLTQLPADPQ
ncbi:hypothetical protein EBZ35_03565 [bacterium]|nr:hypothetical protein [bacterium]